jgi:hypothetical protein
VKPKLGSPSPARVARGLSPPGRGECVTLSAIDTAVAAIHSAFNRAAEIDAFKLRVERWLCLGPQHPALRARFRARTAALSDWTLAAAIREV